MVPMKGDGGVVKLRVLVKVPVQQRHRTRSALQAGAPDLCKRHHVSLLLTDQELTQWRCVASLMWALLAALTGQQWLSVSVPAHLIGTLLPD